MKQEASPVPVPSPWLTLPQGAAYVHMRETRFKELVYAGKIPSHKRSECRVFVFAPELDAWMLDLPSGARVPEALRSVS